MQSSLFGDNFVYVLVIGAIVAHLVIVLIVIYYSCRKDGCKCRTKTSNNTSDQAVEQENAIIDETQTNNAASDLDSLEDIRVNRATARQVTTWQSSLLARVRVRIQRNNNPRFNYSDNRHSQANSGQSSHSSFTNQGISFEEENTDLYLPSYQQYSRQQGNIHFDIETRQYVIEKPPSYQEVMGCEDIQNNST